MTRLQLLQDYKYKRFLDGEFLFRYYWVEMGTARSVRKLAAYCRTQNIVNPDTMRQPTPMAIWFAMWHWAIENQEAAYEICQKVAYDEGKFYSPTDWEKDMQDKAKTVYKDGSSRLKKWQKAQKKGIK